MRAAAAILATLLLGGCAADNTLTEQPAMYVNMATAARGSIRWPRPR